MTLGASPVESGARGISLPLRFQIGARTLASVRRQLVPVALSLDGVVDGVLPPLPPLDRAAHGYAITSLPEDRHEAMVLAAGGGLIAHVRQRYTRHYIDLATGFETYRATLSGNTRAGLKRKTKRLTDVSGDALDLRRFHTPDELAAFHDIARGISRRTYQERLLGGGLPSDPAFLRGMYRLAAVGAVRAWLLYVAGEPAAYLYCPVEAGTVRYDHVGHDPAFDHLSPGAVLMMAALGDLFAEKNLLRFDFTEGDGQHKASMATHGVKCLDLLLLRPSFANRATALALGTFDRGAALAKMAVQRWGLHGLARKLRR